MRQFVGITFLCCVCLFSTGCTTVIVIADITASTILYVGKTAVNIVDAVTPDIIN